MMITKMMITNTPIMTPIIPRFITGPPFVLLEVPACSSRKHEGAQPTHCVVCRACQGLQHRSVATALKLVVITPPKATACLRRPAPLE
jgi:hypothetical protein